MAEDRDASGDLERTVASRDVIVDIVIGVVVAILAWWLIDVVSLNISRSFRIAHQAPGPFLLVTATAVIATVVLTRSAVSLAAAIVVMAVGIVIGGYGSGTSLIDLGDGYHVFLIMRVAHAPETWVLTGAWLAIFLSHLWRGRRTST